MAIPTQEEYVILAKQIEQETGFSQELSLGAAKSIIDTDLGISPTYTLEEVYRSVLKPERVSKYV